MDATKPITMRVRSDQTHPIIKLKNTTIQEVEQFCYLKSSIIYNNNRSTTEIKIEISLIKQAFMKKYSVLTDKYFNIKLEKNY